MTKSRKEYIKKLFRYKLDDLIIYSIIAGLLLGILITKVYVEHAYGIVIR